MILEAAGYSVTRAAASVGAWDLVGVGRTDIVLVQVMVWDRPCAAKQETLRAFTARRGLVVSFTVGGTASACPTFAKSAPVPGKIPKPQARNVFAADHADPTADARQSLE